MILTKVLQCKPRSSKLRQIDPPRRHGSTTSYRIFKEQSNLFDLLDPTGLPLRLPSKCLLNVQFQTSPFAVKFNALLCMHQSHNVTSALAFLIINHQTASAVTENAAHVSYQKIIWKIKTKINVNVNTHMPPATFSTPVPKLTPAKKKKMKTRLSDKYEWEEYDHSEVFEKPDNEEDLDYVPPMED